MCLPLLHTSLQCHVKQLKDSPTMNCLFQVQLRNPCCLRLIGSKKFHRLQKRTAMTMNQRGIVLNNITQNLQATENEEFRNYIEKVHYIQIYTKSSLHSRTFPSCHQEKGMGIIQEQLVLNTSYTSKIINKIPVIIRLSYKSNKSTNKSIC